MRKLILITASLLTATGVWSASCPTGISDSTVAMDLQLGHAGYSHDDGFLAIKYCKESGGKNCLVVCRSGKIVGGVSKKRINKALSLRSKKSNLQKTSKKYTPSNSQKKKTPKGRRTTAKEIKDLDKTWLSSRNPFSNYSNNKAVAMGGYEGNAVGYVCYAHNTLSSSMRCALDGCEARGEACVVVLENNTWVDKHIAAENLEVARERFYGNKRNSSSSVAQSQSSSSTVNQQCLSQLQTDRDRMYRACLMSAKTKQGGLGGTLAIMGSCKDRAIRQFPNNICYGASPPQPLGPIGSIDPEDRNQSNTGWKYVLTLDSATSLCPMTATRWLYSLEHSEVSGMKRICYYK